MCMHSKIPFREIGSRCRSDMGPPGHISLVKWGPQGGLKALVFWGSPSEIGPTHAC